jgi:hypothetical protein
MQSTSSASEVYDYRHNTIQEEVYAEGRARSAFVESPFKGTCSSNGANKCLSLMINASTFTYFNFEMKAQSAKVMVDPSFGLKYQGKILNLNAFDGQVTIQASTFSHNTLAMVSCSVISEIDNGPLKPEVNSYANIETSKKTALQLKNLISIR